MLSNFKVLALMIIFVSLSVTANVDRSLVNRLLKKAGKPVEWEDLGCKRKRIRRVHLTNCISVAWGKRSSAPELYDVSPEKVTSNEYRTNNIF